MNDTLPTTLRNDNPSDSKSGQNLRQLVDTPIFGIRPVSAIRSQRISFTGGQICKIRRPDLGETGLSQCEIDHAELHGISA